MQKWGFIRAGGFILLTAAAVAFPRVLALRGVGVSVPLDFEDMPQHLYMVDLLAKRGSLSAEQLEDPYFVRVVDRQTSAWSTQWPGGVYHVARGWSSIFGPASIWTTLLTNAGFTIVLLVGVFGLGANIGGARVGRWAALLTAICPPLVASTWYFSLDYPLVAMVIAGLCLLWRTRHFSSRPHSLIFVLWSALGVYVKITYLLYLAIPTCWVLVSGLRRPGERKRVALHGLGGLVIFAGLFLLLYQPDLGRLARTFHEHLISSELPAATITPWSMAWLTAYAKMAAFSMPYPLLLVALPGLILLHSRRAGPAGWFSLAFFWGGYILLTLSSNKMERYLQPLYPLLCVMTAYWVIQLISPRWRTVALTWILALYGAVLWFSHQRPTPWLPGIEIDAPRALHATPDLKRQGVEYHSALHPLRFEFSMPGRRRMAVLRKWDWDADCDLRPVVRVIQDLAGRGARPLALGCLDDLPYRTQNKVMIPLLQTVRHRFLMVTNFLCMGEVSELLRQAPEIIILHGDRNAPEERYPDLKLVARRQVRMKCRMNELDLNLSLLRPVNRGRAGAGAAHPPGRGP